MSGSKRAAGVLRGLLYATAVCCGACGRQVAPHSASATGAADAGPANIAPTTGGAPTTGVAPTTPIAPAAVAPNCLPSHDGYLRLRMRGESNMDIDWHDADMQCDGGPRPGQQGLRVTFLGPGRRGEHNLRFVFGIANGLGLGSSHGVPANVTVIFEGESKLYSTRGEDKCTIDELTQAPIAAARAPRELRVTGRGFCVGAAAAADGGDGLLLSRFDFAGVVVDE
jgi:hypothetical protein